ncbi:isoaspartyl peptidase/L-asparaginase [Endozoicomonas sp. SM1973]|uniref:Isoaspartyl peptidase n=1 Tax=Spartinivicinus marinus TaxID=2994442 RepID=A0A853IFB9_9GAMM|nr:isoaspartyl peptidase/L-asparaginase [Spartinivicinus marinus]MCX4024783.1 isoaspartyl peptidase/L-asparaginase [Spartinivicinus marinus]NYZ68734.1 isoaspartyl peptidase/L-asparaginase [Spartinivicinus marinus]
MSNYVLLIHGGAGQLPTDFLTAEREQAYIQQLSIVLSQGQQALAAGAKAEQVVVDAVAWLENCPLFNAGCGAVLTHAGTFEFDAALMLGNRQSGAVMAVKQCKNPIIAAQQVLHNSVHNTLAGPEADAWLLAQGVEQAPQDYFLTEHRLQQLQEARENQQVQLDHSDNGQVQQLLSQSSGEPSMGTVGAVALDAHGELAAATSTGGVTNQLPGRVGDSPIIGAGTLADQRSCAISGTGIGEYFIRYTVTAEIHYRMLLADQSLTEAAELVVNQNLPAGTGGVIAVDNHGHWTMPFNTTHMFRGVVTPKQLHAFIGK